MRSISLALLLCLSAATALASSVDKVLPGAKLRGESTFRYLGFQLYDARLYTKNGAALDWSDDFALELTYKRSLTQYDLVEATLREMKRIRKPLPSRAKLEACYKAVQPGDQYLAVTQGANKVQFWRNGRAVCTLSGQGIKDGFMSVFLSTDSRSQRFTRALLGQ
ncbi:hypothetical protein [Planktotalea sp.]|uniref:chalcone isomerase family protein n=1 Tax=Planktotalea sp. TaxID=2029877 RepID=UPI00329A5AF7